MLLLSLPIHQLESICIPYHVQPSQEFVWWSIASYFDAHAPEGARKKCRNISQKKKFIQEVLKMPLQFDRGLGCWMFTRVFNS